MIISCVLLPGFAVRQHSTIDTAIIIKMMRSVASARKPLARSNENMLEPIIIATIKQANTVK